MSRLARAMWRQEAPADLIGGEQAAAALTAAEAAMAAARALAPELE
ncbi:hypothetical protein ACE7GA_01835 [Roseomonas sp. CCTCC AB2023176]